jgi:hypothetical protein
VALYRGSAIFKSAPPGEAETAAALADAPAVPGNQAPGPRP